MEKLGDCRNVEQLILTGTKHIDDSGISSLINGKRESNQSRLTAPTFSLPLAGTPSIKKASVFSSLKTLKLGGLANLTNG